MDEYYILGTKYSCYISNLKDYKLLSSKFASIFKTKLLLYEYCRKYTGIYFNSNFSLFL